MANSRTKVVSMELAALGTAKTRGFRAPFAGRILSIGVGFHAAVDGDNILQAEIDEVDVTGGVMTATTVNSVAGKTIQCYPTALNEFREGQYISIDTDGGGTLGDAIVSFKIEEY